MFGLSPIFVARLIFITAMLNLAAIGLIYFSCRCTSAGKTWGWLTKRQFYKRFMKYHCYLWWLLWASVTVHAVFAISLLGIPF